MKMKAGVLTVCGAPRPFAKSKPIHVVELDLEDVDGLRLGERTRRTADGEHSSFHFH